MTTRRAGAGNRQRARAHFEAAFPNLTIWLETSAGDDQVLLLTRDALSALPS